MRFELPGQVAVAGGVQDELRGVQLVSLDGSADGSGEALADPGARRGLEAGRTG